MAGVYGRNYLCNSKCIHCLCLYAYGRNFTCTADNIIILIPKHISEQPILLETEIYQTPLPQVLIDKALRVNWVWLARLTTRPRRHLASNGSNSRSWPPNWCPL